MPDFPFPKHVGFHMFGSSPPTLDLSKKVTHAAPMSTEQIKRSVESRPETNQHIKFLEKKKCGVCRETWKEILLGGKISFSPNAVTFFAGTVRSGSQRKVKGFSSV